MSWDMPWGYIVTCVLCTTVAIAYIWVSLNRPHEDRAGPFEIVLALIVFIAALKLFF